MSTYKIGQVYMMLFSGNKHVQQGFRPGLITQNDVGNKYSPNVIAIPLTSSMTKNHIPTHAYLNAVECGLPKNSIALCECETSVSKEDVGAYVTTVPDQYMEEVGICLMKSTPVAMFINTDRMLNLIHLLKTEYKICSA